MHRTGFTLTELLLTLAISAILAAIAAQVWASHLEQHRRAAARAALIATMADLQRQHARSGVYHTDLAAGRATEGYTFSARPCGDRSVTQCVEAVARPMRPDACDTLVLRSTGEREPPTHACWP